MQRLIRKFATHLSRNQEWKGHYTGIDTAGEDDCRWMGIKFYFQRDSKSKRLTYFRMSSSYRQWIYFNLGFQWFTYRIQDGRELQSWWFINPIERRIKKWRKARQERANVKRWEEMAKWEEEHYENMHSDEI